jgi:hypothetical protein
MSLQHFDAKTQPLATNSLTAATGSQEEEHQQEAEKNDV